MSVYLYIRFVCVFVFMFVCVYVCMCVYVFMCVCVCVCVCTRVFVCGMCLCAKVVLLRNWRGRREREEEVVLLYSGLFKPCSMQGQTPIVLALFKGQGRTAGPVVLWCMYCTRVRVCVWTGFS